jgi:hypothetical protein
MIVYINGYVYEHESLYDNTLSHMTQLLVSGECERYEPDRLYYYGSSMYMVTVQGRYTIIWISIFIHIVHRYSVVHIITDSYKIYI